MCRENPVANLLPHAMLNPRMSRSFPITFLFLLALLPLLAGCKKLDKVNVVIVSMDTTRADHLACYGHPRASTPTLDKLAEEGVLFENAFTPVPITCPSHSTMMTGKVPFGHGIRDNALFVLSEKQETLAEILKKEGYACGAAIGSFPLLSRFGLNQGFDYYNDQLGEASEDEDGNKIVKRRKLYFDERKAALVNESIFPWIEQHKDGPFFCWLHYFDPHHPHEPPSPYNFRFADDLYLGEIAYGDECIGVLIDKLKELGVYENTLFVFLSDHGEGNGQHNEFTHSLLAYNSTLHIPLIIKNPGGAKDRRISHRVGTVDLLPTILDRIGIKPPDDLQGISLLDCLSTDYDESKHSESQSLYAETLAPRLSHGLGEIRAYFDGDYKYLHGPRKELFNIAKDPNELDNLIEKEPEIASKMRSRLENYIEDNATDHYAQQVTIDDETARRLMALGYLGSGGAEEVGEEKLRDDGIAPQERVIDNALLSQAKHYLTLMRPREAREAIIDLLERAPHNPAYLSLFGECERMSGNYEAALKVFEELLETENAAAIIHPDKTLIVMAGMELRLGHPDKAIERLEEAQDFNETGETHYHISQVYRSQGKNDKYYAELELAVEFADCPESAWLELAIFRAQLGDEEGAEDLFRQALEAKPYSSRILYNLAAFELQKGNQAEALRLADRALEIRPDYTFAHFLKFQICLEMKDLKKAKAALEAAKTIAPDDPQIQVMRNMLKKASSEK